MNLNFRPPGVWVDLREHWRSGEAPPSFIPKMRVALSPASSLKEEATLEFSIAAPRPLLSETELPPPGFRTELWRADVAELFLLNPETGVYLELHLNPRSAWWAGRFTAPRVLDPVQDFCALPVSASTKIETACWSGSLRLPWKPLAEALSFSPESAAALRSNFTAIVWHPEGRRFFSAAPLRGEKPDFHQPEEWPETETAPGAIG